MSSPVTQPAYLNKIEVLISKHFFHYLKENLLAQSLHEKAYERNPGFRQFIERSGLPFQAHREFKKPVFYMTGFYMECSTGLK